MERTVFEIIEGIEEIPTLPSVAIEVMSLSKTPDVSVREISECIFQDPPLAAKVLKMANSPFYRRGPQEVDTLHRAILMIGLNEIINITASISILTVLGPRDKEGETLRQRFWHHCVATALVARHIDKKLHMNSRGREFVGGLLHDIGKIIFDEFFHDKYLKAHELSREKGCFMHEAEEEIFGATHMEVGNFLARKWNLPPYIADINLNHHHPREAQFKDISSLISISDLLAKAKEFSFGGDSMPFVLKDQEAWIVLGKMGYPMDSLDIERITFEMEDIGKEVRAYISTVTDPSSGDSVHG